MTATLFRSGLMMWALAYAIASSPPAHAEASRRVALVIGNGDYSTLAKLSNPVTDARVIAAALKARGFAVSEHYDLSRADLLDALEQFKQTARAADVAVAFYAGHGMEIAGKNIIAPVDTEIVCEPKEARRAVALDELFEAVSEAQNQIVLLDACRNDPFPQCPTRAAQAGSGFRGIQRIGASDRSLLIANATLSGQLAADGDPGAHSPFAKALLARFSSDARVPWRDLLDLTARDVMVGSKGQQTPEIITRGGAPRLCLDPQGCGGEGAGALTDQGAIAEAARLLAELGYQTDQTRGGIADPIRRFQRETGLEADGTLTPTLLAILRATRTRLAALPKPGKPDAPDIGVPGVSAEHAAGSVFRDCESCPEMVALPAGSFRMGADKSAGGRSEEAPPHEVSLARPIAVGKFEIEFDEWETCALEGGCPPMPADGGWGRGKRPVINVTWDDAKAYVNWLRQKTGKPYRLLTEAEWEYAARAGTTTPYATGETIVTAQANFDASSDAPQRRMGAYEGKTVEAGSFPANPFGLYDLHGNVAEWVEDCWNPTHAGAPQDGSARGGDCARRVAKGGAWYYEAPFLRSAARVSYPAKAKLNIVGFRVARPLE